MTVLADCRLCAGGVPHLDVMCALERQVQAGMPAAHAAAGGHRTAGETLAAVDATMEGRCAGPRCGIPLTADSPSGWWCSPECQAAYHRQGTDRPGEVRGSTGVAADPARWRPDLVDTFDDTDLRLVRERAKDGFTYRWYFHTDGRRFLRIDDGNRWVGAYAEAVDGPQVELWRRLERELTDPRRLDPDAPEAMDPEVWRQFSESLGRSMEQAAAGFVEWAHQAAQTLAPLVAELERSGVLDEDGPTDPQGWYWCATCQQTGEPELDRDYDTSLFSFRVARVRPPRYACPHCHATVPRDLRLTVQREDDGGQLLRVERGGRQAEHHLGAWYLREVDDPEALILRTLVQLQQDVAPPVPRAEPAQRVWRIVDDPPGQPQAEMVSVDPADAAAGAVYWTRQRPDPGAYRAAQSFRTAAGPTQAGQLPIQEFAATEFDWSTILRRMGEALDREVLGTATTVPPPPSGEDIMTTIRALSEQLAGHNPVVRMEVAQATAEQLFRQARPSPAPADPVTELMRIPIVPDPSLPPGAWRTVHADGQRRETHTCRWEVSFETGYYRCSLRWPDGTRCDSTATDSSTAHQAERTVGPSATGGGS